MNEPRVGDIVVYVGPSDYPKWRWRRDQRVEYVVIMPPRPGRAEHELTAIRCGDEGDLNDWITVAPRYLRVLRRATYLDEEQAASVPSVREALSRLADYCLQYEGDSKDYDLVRGFVDACAGDVSVSRE